MADQFKACSVSGCKGNAHYSTGAAKGFCQMHYARFRKYGDPLFTKTAPEGDGLRLLESLIDHKGEECVRWPYGKTNRGYGITFYNGTDSYAHRVMCVFEHGAPPTPEHEAAHSCGNRPCVNPHHLSWKTKTENQADRLIHGTHSRGERSGNAKLTEEQVREIRALRGIKTQKQIAIEHDVSQGAVSDIFHGRSWFWLE